MEQTNEQAVAEPALTPPPGRRSRRAALFIVFLVVFIDLLGFGIVLPLLPLYANLLLVPLFPGDTQGHLRGAILGLLSASFSAMQFFFAPIWGRTSDRIGRRPILMLGLFGSVVFYSLFGIASEIGIDHHVPGLGLALLFVSRIGAGIAGATISTAQAVIADVTPAEGRSRGMALLGAAFGIGFTFGPLFGYGSFALPDAGAPGFLAATLSCVALVLAFVLLPETLSPSTTGLRRKILDWGGTLRVLRLPSVGALVLTFFLTTIAFGSLESTLSLLNQYLLHPEAETHFQALTREAALDTERKNFLVFAYIGLVLMIIQGFVYRRLVRRVGELRFLRIGVLFMAAGLAAAVAVGIAAAPERAVNRDVIWAAALAVMTIAVIGFAFLTPSVQSLISLRSDPRTQGEVLGVNQSGAALARILGPIFGLSLFYVTPTHVLPYACGAILLLAVYWYTLRIPRA